MVSVVRNLEEFFARESCGWCTPCRDGLPWSVKIAAGDRARRGHPPRTSTSCSGLVDLPRPGQDLLRARAGRDGAAAERVEVFPRGVRAAASRATTRRAGCLTAGVTARTNGDHPCRRQSTTKSTARTTCCRPVCRSVSTFPTSAGTRRSASVGACRQCAVKQYANDERQARPAGHVLHDAGHRQHAASPSTTRKRRRSATASSNG